MNLQKTKTTKKKRKTCTTAVDNGHHQYTCVSFLSTFGCSVNENKEEKKHKIGFLHTIHNVLNGQDGQCFHHQEKKQNKTKRNKINWMNMNGVLVQN
ncbi:hypothetical protein DERF_008645, partial [Dermatophagoides farinae]